MKLHCRTYMADCHTPVSLYRRLSRDSEASFLLESVEQGSQVGRYSFIGVDPAESYRGSFAGLSDNFEPIEYESAGLPPFRAGLVGAVRYEVVEEFESLRLRHCGGEPVAAFDDYRTVVAFDHATRRLIVMSLEGTAALSRIEKKLSTPLDLEPVIPLEGGGTITARSSFSQDAYEQAVRKAREYVIAGDIFQVVLSQQFSAEFAGDPFAAYRALRLINPSPYMFYIENDDSTIIGSSPEMLVRTDGRRLDYSPIAGTRPRGNNPAEESALANDLLQDEKERAEHLMLVDLGRNDLGRVSEFGSVQVERFMEVEKFSHVMHLTSRLGAHLKQGLTAFDAFRACFPAGTVTGAPKIRAMEIIDELETVRRGNYAGGIGYFDHGGAMDTCIAIRTMVIKGGVARWSAGAGIVYDSVPALEYQECRNKARALKEALALATQMESRR